MEAKGTGYDPEHQVIDVDTERRRLRFANGAIPHPDQWKASSDWWAISSSVASRDSTVD
ncbi:MAG TPA: hypothetical protein VE569_07190 [Acidimicrobiia bacterium]|nr:hypothetical protein [Acidimicrobiia bacterium]